MHLCAGVSDPFFPFLALLPRTLYLLPPTSHPRSAHPFLFARRSLLVELVPADGGLRALSDSVRDRADDVVNKRGGSGKFAAPPENLHVVFPKSVLVNLYVDHVLVTARRVEQGQDTLELVHEPVGVLGGILENGGTVLVVTGR